MSRMAMSMKKLNYVTVTGRQFDLNKLSEAERDFLARVRGKYATQPGWPEFASWWTKAFAKLGLTPMSVTYRICQDLEGRLGIAQGLVAPPDYRDYLAALIDERYGSTYKFCKETGVDPGQLSRVFASRADLSLQSLQKILQSLGAALVVEVDEVIARNVCPKRAAAALAAATR